MLLADGDYQILSEPGIEISEDARNIIGELTEALSPSSEEIVNVSNRSLASEGKPRT
jgi:hypothetical protein